MHSRERMYLFQTWLQSAKEEQSVAVAESQPLPPRSVQSRQTPPWICVSHPPLAARLPASETNLSEELLNFCCSQQGVLYTFIFVFIDLWCVLQKLLWIGQKESKPFVSPPTGGSGSLSWSPLKKKSGFPDLRASRRNSCSQYSPAGTPQFCHISVGKQKLGQIFKREKKHHTLGSMVWDSVLRAPWLSSPSSNIFTEVPQNLHLNWLKVSQSSFFPQLILSGIMKDSFLCVWNLPGNQRILRQGKTLGSCQTQFLNKGLGKSLPIRTGKPWSHASKMS